MEKIRTLPLRRQRMVCLIRRLVKIGKYFKLKNLMADKTLNPLLEDIRWSL